MWDIILNPFITVMTLLYAIFGNNIVISIVILTVFVRMLTYPLLAKQRDSAEKMKDLQPRLKKIQEKYKDDREKLAQAQMELYKEAGVNPLGGCLPLLIQFPVIIGLYQAIFFALAATPFQLVDLSERLLIPGLDALIPLEKFWLGMDLTQPPTPPGNPAYALALPVLVMATTWLQFKLQPGMGGGSNTDDDDGKPNQAAAMTKSMGTIMPIMFGAIALSFSVGLSVYFLVSNLVGIVQYSPMGKRVLDQWFTSEGRKKKRESKANKEGDEPAKLPEPEKKTGKGLDGSKKSKKSRK